MIFAGFYLTYRAWLVLHDAQKEGKLATTGPYGVVRHPQYDGFILIMLGFLLMWPTLLTLAMFPVLVVVYIRLARQEEKLVRAEFGATYDDYEKKVAAFLPSWRRSDVPHMNHSHLKGGEQQ